MQIGREELSNGLSGLLGHESSAYFDHGANCLQIKGQDNIEHIVTGVSASLELFQAAAEMNAQAIIVHHGLIFPNGGVAMDDVLRNRLKVLFEHNISLFAYHYLLDIHPQVGNASGIARLIGARIGDPFGYTDGQPWGYEAVIPHAIDRDKLELRLEKIRNDKLPAIYLFGKDQIEKCGIVTGSGSDCLYEAAMKKLDAVIVGDIREGTQAIAKELNLNVYAIGHYRSETSGPRSLADWIKTQYGVGATFIDVPNLA